MGQALHFLFYNKGASDYAAERYGKETQRLYGVMDKQLSKQDFIAGDYSIADMAIWPWITRHERQQISLDDYPNVQRWYRAIAARPAVVKGFKVLAEDEEIPGL
jgi:GST-like protein